MNEATHSDSACCHTSADRSVAPEDGGMPSVGLTDGTVQDQVIKRLARIEGQVKGISRMVDERRYCIDIVNQISAAQSALNGVTDLILRNHLETCVANAMTGNDPADRRAKIDELIKVYSRARSH